ncbi:MAG: type IX secretion system membrane protein PorP/SprF [Bacteroidetes bacterium]|nr:type IX secretion system membrane protein PorP/SprF [Bacteroidota bacterium]
MRRWKKTYLFIIFTLILFFAKAQDPQFTQFYAAPLYLNPAFTGLTYEHRFTLNYRNQWPGINKTYSTYMATYDYNLNALNSGVGLLILQDRAGTAGLTTTMLGGNYAYRVKIGKFSEARGGISFTYCQKKIDDSKLIFNDMLITGASVSKDASGIVPINYMDITLGGLFNSQNFWGGFSAKHINQPNVSLVGDIQPLPVSISVHGGYRYIIKARGSGKTKLEEFVSGSVNYRHELKYDQLDIGAYYFKDFINLGIWYRGLPFKHYKPGYPSRESIAFLIGFELPDRNIRIGYSFDLTISTLGINNTQGAHEISLVYELSKPKKRTRRILVTCPKF